MLVFFPRRFNADMFCTNKTDIIEDENGEGFTPFTGLAVLYNQFRGDFKNKLTVDNGDITVATEKASIHIDTSGNVKVNENSGKVNIKNSSQSLYGIFDSLLSLLNGGTVATAGSQSAQTITSGQFTQQIEEMHSLLSE